MSDSGEHQNHGTSVAPASPVAPASYPSPPGKTNGFAIASLVLGIIWLGWLGSILALVFGYIGKSQIDRSNGMESGRGLAIAGIVLGWVGAGALAVVVVLVIIGSSSDPSTSDSRATDARQADEEGASRTLEGYAQATRDKDYQTICNELYAKDVVDRVRAAGLPCEVAVRTGLDNRRNPRLEVLGVEVNGDRALARVRSTATGEPTSTDLIRLIKEEGDWHIASLSEPGATLQTP